MLPTPEGLEREDLRWRTKLVHAPFNSVPRAALMNPHLMGMARMDSIVVTMQAARERTALVTATEWRAELQRLLIARQHRGGLSALALPRGLGADVGWRSRALVDTLADAAEAFAARGGDAAERVHILQSAILVSLRDPSALHSLLDSLRSRLSWWISRVPEVGGRWGQAAAEIEHVWRSLLRCVGVFSGVLDQDYIQRLDNHCTIAWRDFAMPFLRCWSGWGRPLCAMPRLMGGDRTGDGVPQRGVSPGAPWL